jgi:hypothetical protein
MTAPPLIETWGADCPSGSVEHLPRNVPVIWPYVTGTPSIRWTGEQIAQFPHSRIIRVDQGFESRSPFDADEFDIEAGAWSDDAIAGIVAERRTRRWSTRLYGTWDTYGAVKQELAARGIGQSVFWRIADWDLDQHFADLELHGDVYAGQWASPSSNPRTILPGTRLTLAEANADLSVMITVNTGWAG